MRGHVVENAKKVVKKNFGLGIDPKKNLTYENVVLKRIELIEYLLEKERYLCPEDRRQVGNLP